MNAPLKIKVCGNKEPENLVQVCALHPEFIGFIFYEESKRFVSKPAIGFAATDCKAKRVGVFVNASEGEIREKVDAFNLDFVQLHGDESPEFCESISQIRPVFKAFQIDNNFNFNTLTNYLSVCYMFLFDTASKSYGGSGKKFDWGLLSSYKGSVPFLLSGGIVPTDAASIKELEHPMLAGVDINSQFEIEHGIKDINKLKEFFKQFER
ncbi:MAG: phosphoribosylanthranilate isomerase [Cyclobacteriaceae bacterium]|nr:phosphoribosylanthranilate isomerase [Cyclobacteriaceae bacterium]